MLPISQRDQVVLDALDENIKNAPSFGICAEAFHVLKEEFLRVMHERDEALERLREVDPNVGK